MRVGIDLGTTNTVVSYIDENGSWKLLEFRRCGRTENLYLLPSCIAERNGVIVVGQQALDHGLAEPSHLLKDKKTDLEPSRDRRTDMELSGSAAKTFTIGRYTLTPQEVAEYVLKEVHNELKRQFPKERSFNAYVTVPAKFGQHARAATKAALRNAGFDMDENCLTDEPVAAAIAYSTKLEHDKLVLVVDIGGGTFDLSLLKSTIVMASGDKSRLIPVSWGGDPHLGGNNFDDLLVKKMAMTFLQDGGPDLYVQHGSTLPTPAETRAAAIMRAQAFSLKKQLYTESSEQASVFVNNLLDGRNFNFTISVSDYDACMSELAGKMVASIDGLFSKTNYSSGDVDRVLVVGGMAHEICLKKILEGLFGENRLIIPEDSMYLVSRGAAISNSNLRVHVENKAYTSIGLLKHTGTDVDVIIEEGSTVKTGHVFWAELYPAEDNATAMEIKLVEFTGKFSPETSTVILCDTVQLSETAKEWSLCSLFKKKQKPKLLLSIVFTEDKLLKITVEQPDGDSVDLSLRLGR